MPDEIDRIQAQEEVLNEAAINAVRGKAAIPAGAPGICKDCEEESPRIVAGRCAPCRDERDGVRRADRA